MNSYELIKAIDSFRKALDDQTEFLLGIREWAESYKALAISVLDLVTPFTGEETSFLDRFFGPPREWVSSRNRIIEILKAAKDQKPFSDPRQMFLNVEKLAATINSLDKAVGHSMHPILKRLLFDLDDFAKAYGELVQKSYLLPPANVFLRSAFSLYQSLEHVIEPFSAIKSELVDTPVQLLDSRLEIIELMLFGRDGYEVVIGKLNALGVIYKELCILFRVSLLNQPLQISKIETGSLWLKLFGESQVIKLMTDLIRSGVQYLHRNFTSEGRLSEVSLKIEVVDATMQLEQRMRQLGFDTHQMREDIQKAGVIVAKQSTILLAGESVIMVNGQTYSVGDALEQRYIEKGQTRLLESGDDESETSEKKT